jgi:spore germination protein YaaH
MRRTPASLLTIILAAGLLPAAVHAAGPASDPLPPGAVLTSDGRVLPAMPAGMQETSANAEMLAAHANDPNTFQPGGRPTVLLSADGSPTMAEAAVAPDGTLSAAELSAAGLPNGLRKEVFGFLPYWMLSASALDSMNYQLVSTIAYFSVGAQKDGDLAKGTSSSPTTGWAGWKSSAMTSVIDRAHEQGVKVVLTVTMMAWDSASSSRQADLLQSSTARSRLVNQVVSAVRDRGADGVNLDFEPLASSLRDEYVSFVKQLKRGLVNAGVGDYLTVSVMASAATWATGYDVAGLTASGAADALFVMGYDYNWSGSSRAGGVAPVQSPYTIDVAGTMADFLTQTSGSRIIWGVPYYGRTWPTETGSLNSRTLGGGSKSYYYTGHLAQAAQYGRRWDDVGKVPWYRHWDSAAGHWVQGYYDDVESLGVKYDLINSRGLKGTGMWTLLMDQGRDELWRLLARKFVNDTAPPVGGIRLLPASTDGLAFPVSWRAQDYASGVASYSVQWRRPGGSWHDWLMGTKTTSAWFTGTADRTYQFRFRATDMKGNVQGWTDVPAKPATLQPAAFGQVVASTLNVRSGPGTSYGIVDSAVAGDMVYVLEGPVAAGGYDWYRVQYGFSEWPSADYPRIAWMAGASSGTPMIVPAQSPASTRLRPFVDQGSRTATFSPNGDGVQDIASIGFDLRAAVTSARLDLLDAGGSVVRSISLGSLAAGANLTSWDGRLASGDFAADGRYLARVTVTDADGAQHAAPSPSFSAAALTRWGITVDRTRPAVTATPRPASAMVPGMAPVKVAFSEPMVGLGGGMVVVAVNGSPIPGSTSVAADARSVVVTPASPLASDAEVDVTLDASVRDSAGNPPAVTAWSFSTAPGLAYDPARRGTLAGGTRTAFDIGQDGDLLRKLKARLGSATVIRLAQRAQMPNLPGHWLYVASGPLAGHWLRESAAQHVNGEVSRATYANAQAIRLAAGTHIGYRFESDGSVRRTRSVSLSSRTTVSSYARAVINGVTYWRVAGGSLDGFWLEQSAAAYRRGFTTQQSFGLPPVVDVAAGTYTAYAYSGRGTVTGTRTARVTSTTGVRVSSWAIINGTPCYLASNGPWAGFWLAETKATTLRV